MGDLANVYIFVLVIDKMDKKVLKEVRGLCKPLRKLSPLLKAVWIYGSFLKKDKYDPKSDIDVMVVVDDTRSNYDQGFMKKLVLFLKIIESKAKKEGIKIHFQPPKTLSFLWEIIRSGEPWVVTSFERVQVLYDVDNFVVSTKGLLRNKEMFNDKYKVEKLAESAYERFYEAKEIMLKKIPLELFFIIVETAQGILSYYGKYPASPGVTLDDMRELFGKHESKRVFVEYFEELYNMTDKINRDVLVEFTGEDLDRAYKMITEFVLESEGIITALESKKRIENIDRVFIECKDLCIDALKKRNLQVPIGDKEMLSVFKKEFIDSGNLESYHLKTLKELFDYHNKREEIKPNSEDFDKLNDKKFALSYVKSLKLVLNDIIKENEKE